MSTLRNGSVKCDGCGRLSADRDGYYVGMNGPGTICSHGRSCEHDYCEDCEAKLAPWPACLRCGQLPDGHDRSQPPRARCATCGGPRQVLLGVEQATCGMPLCEATAAQSMLGAGR